MKGPPGDPSGPDPPSLCPSTAGGSRPLGDQELLTTKTTVPSCSLATWLKGPELGVWWVPSVSLVEVPPGTSAPRAQHGGRGGPQRAPSHSCPHGWLLALRGVGGGGHCSSGPPHGDRLKRRPHPALAAVPGAGACGSARSWPPTASESLVALFPPLRAKDPRTDVRHCEFHHGGSLIFSYFFTHILGLCSGILLNYLVLLGLAFLRFKWDQSSVFCGLLIFHPVPPRGPRNPETS